VRFAIAPPVEGPLAPRAEFSLTAAATLAREILALDEPAYRERFRGSAIKRAKLSGLQRNAAIVLTNVTEA
jgi:epoxyqueuosine reductase